MRIVFVVTSLPWPLEKTGAAQRIGLMASALRQLGELCIVVVSNGNCYSTPQFEPYIQTRPPEYELQHLEVQYGREAGLFRFVKCFLWGRPRELAKDMAASRGDFSTPDDRCCKQFQQIISEFKPDAVVCRCLKCAVATGAPFIAELPVLLDYDDNDWRVQEAWEEQINRRHRLKIFRSRLLRWSLRRNAIRALRRFAHIWVASEEDQGVIGRLPCSVLPNVPILPASNDSQTYSPADQNPVILFVGTLGYGPNKEGLDHFLAHVWSKVQGAEPSVKLRVVGPLPDDGGKCVARWLRSRNVEVLGFVDDLGPEYERATITIAPVYWGGGTKIKVLESLGRGRTCVITPHALYGLRSYIKHDDSVWCAENDEEFAGGCLNLVRSKELRQRLATRGRQVIEDHFSVARFDKAVVQILARYQ